MVMTLGKGAIVPAVRRALGLPVLVTATLLSGCGGPSQVPSQANAGANEDNSFKSAPPTPSSAPMPRIIQESLFKQGYFYGVQGTVFNPTNHAMKNVVIRYYLFKSHMGKPDEGLLVQRTGGLVEARLNYLPPQTPVQFIAFSENAPTGGRIPEVQAEITAEWD
jgi:hypothetical protein